jgi:hypothetical protein
MDHSLCPRRSAPQRLLAACFAVALLLTQAAFAAPPSTDRAALRAGLAADLLAREDTLSKLAGAAVLAQDGGLDGAVTLRLVQGENAFARLRHGSDDPRVLWVAAAACPYAEEVCEPATARADLLEAEPDNGANWLLAAIAAVEADDNAALRGALAGMARADRFDLRTTLLLRPIHDALRSRSDDPGWRAYAAEVLAVDATRVDAGLAALVLAAEFGLAVDFPAVATLADRCSTPQARAEGLRRPCERALLRMARHASTVHEAQVGYAAAARIAGSARRRLDYSQRVQALAWLSDEARSRSVADGLDAVRGDLTRLVAAPSELAWMRANIEARGLRAAPGLPLDTPALARRD